MARTDKLVNPPRNWRSHGYDHRQ